MFKIITVGVCVVVQWIMLPLGMPACHIRVPISSLATPLLIQPLPHTSWEAVDNGSDIWILLHMWESQVNFQVPRFGLDRLCCEHLSSDLVDRSAHPFSPQCVSVCLSLCISLSFK